MIFQPTPTQALLLFGLLAKHGECKQAELMPAILAKDRAALVGAKLIAAEKISRSFKLTLTDAGWGWAGAHLSAELPPAHGTLHDWLARLGEHFARSGETLADFIGSKPEPRAAAAKPKAAEKAVATKKPAAKKTAKPKAPTPAALRKRIEAAYLAITGGQKDVTAPLARLRAELTDLDRAIVDVALGRILQGDKQGGTKASLMRNDDPRRLDEADRKAAFSPSGEPFHMIWIAS